MTPEQFVIWLRGFTEGVHEFNVSPKQWDILKDKLAEVEEVRSPIEKKTIMDAKEFQEKLIKHSKTNYNYILTEKNGNI